MSPELGLTWGGSLHSTFRILPTPSAHLEVFLTSDGLTPDEVLQRLPYDTARSSKPGLGPDPKRYRDSRQVYQTAGLIHESEGVVQVTDLGRATGRWLSIIHEGNAPILGRHAAFALAACQLRNPTGAGQRYAGLMEVFPFAMIWRVMLSLGGRINSDELNRAVFCIRNEDDFPRAVEAIKAYRASGDPDLMGPETESGANKNDRIIPWMSLASFGWTILNDKSADAASTHYTIPSRCESIIREASRIRHKHRDFESVRQYVEHLSDAAALPKDQR